MVNGSFGADEPREVGMGLRSDAVPSADDIGDRFRFQLQLVPPEARPVRDSVLLVPTEMAQVQMPQLMRQRCELDGGVVIAVDTHCIRGRSLSIVGTRTRSDANVTGACVPGINPVHEDVATGKPLGERAQAVPGHRAFRDEAEHVRRQSGAFRIHNVIHERHRTKRPEDEQRPGAFPRPPPEIPRANLAPTQHTAGLASARAAALR